MLRRDVRVHPGFRCRRARRDRAIPVAVCLTSSDPDSNISGSTRYMTVTETLTLGAYFFVLIVLAVYGWHRYYLVYLYLRYRDQEPRAEAPLDPLPVVTIQLPLYNEMYVADRLIEAVCAINYPRDLLEIQVLDDSTDETRSVAELAVRRFAAQGHDIKYIHRTNRVGYKAGALEEGLKVARGEFVAIFDAEDRKSTRL